MNIQIAHSRYRNEENYFAPEYEGENDVLNEFYSLHPNLSSEEINYLKDTLQNADDWPDKYFVADLMYLYNPIPNELLQPILCCAILHEDPSFNRIFLKPCIKSFGLKRIKNLLDEKENNGDMSEKEGIARLRYWLRPVESENEGE